MRFLFLSNCILVACIFDKSVRLKFLVLNTNLYAKIE